MRRAALAVVAAAVLAVPAAHAHTWCGAQIQSARWIVLPEGKRLVVRPSACGRRTATRSTRAAFAEAIRRGGRGAPDYRSLYWQFLCHARVRAHQADMGPRGVATRRRAGGDDRGAL